MKKNKKKVGLLKKNLDKIIPVLLHLLAEKWKVYDYDSFLWGGEVEQAPQGELPWRLPLEPSL